MLQEMYFIFKNNKKREQIAKSDDKTQKTKC